MYPHLNHTWLKANIHLQELEKGAPTLIYLKLPTVHFSGYFIDIFQLLLSSDVVSVYLRITLELLN